jgi:hypothetical protein
MNNSIFQSIEEFVVYVPNVSLSTSWDKIYINCINAINKYIIPVLGSDILESNDDDIIDNLKHCVANYAAYEITQVGNSIITESSSSYTESVNLKANFGEKQDTLNFYSSTGDFYLEQLIVLSQNKNIEILSKVSSVFFKNIEEFETHRFLSKSNRTFLALQPTICLIENMDILPRVQGLIDTLFDNPEYNSLLFFIRAYIASSTLLSAIPGMKVRYHEGGINIVSFIPNIEAKYNKEEESRKIEQLKIEIEKISINLERELNKALFSESLEFKNVSTNKGFSF